METQGQKLPNTPRRFMKNATFACLMILGLLTGVSFAQESSLPIVYIGERAEYKDVDVISDNIVKECTKLNAASVNYFKHYAEKLGYEVRTGDRDTDSPQDKFLKLYILNAHSGGNAFTGHHKSVKILAELYENGRLVASVEKERRSSGGFFGDLKSSCSVLDRCVKTLGSDVAKWMKEVKIEELVEQPSSVDIPEQIKKLAELRDEGILTEEEFQAKKTELLERL